VRTPPHPPPHPARRPTAAAPLRGAIYTCVELDEAEDGFAIRTELEAIVGRSSVPAVFVGGEFVGGANDGGLGGVLTLHAKGQLAPLLMRSGSLSPTQRI